MIRLPKIALFLGISAVLFFSAKSGQCSDVFNHPAQDQYEGLRKVVTHLKNRQSVTREFKQEKKIKAIKRPLISSGLLLVTPTGICWSTQRPFESTMKITPVGIVQKVGTNDKTEKKASDKMEIRSFIKIMMALFSADEQSLNREFHLYFKGDLNQWSLGLKPKRKIMGKILSSIIISGSNDIENIVINEANGDMSNIHITGSSSQTELSLETCVK